MDTSKITVQGVVTGLINVLKITLLALVLVSAGLATLDYAIPKLGLQHLDRLCWVLSQIKLVNISITR